MVPRLRGKRWDAIARLLQQVNKTPSMTGRQLRSNRSMIGLIFSGCSAAW
ncbi:MAG: hypothetical protein SW833_24695 [Cyanobacteriota bacterium]|nr:hypothetical protein [Cyanobacteriota bacterium]